METKTTSHFTCQSKSFISIFFTSQVSSCELQLFSCHDLANSIYSQTAKLRSATLKVRKKVRELNWLRFHIWQELITNLILSWADSHIYNRLLFHPNFQILEFFQWFSKISGGELKTIRDRSLFIAWGGSEDFGLNTMKFSRSPLPMLFYWSDPPS